MIDPNNPEDYPLCLKELELIKRSRERGIMKKAISQYELVKVREKRQEMIQEWRNKAKTAKKSRKIQENLQIHKTKATSTNIRQREKENSDKEAGKEPISGFKEVDKEMLKNQAYPSKLRWKEGEF